MKKRTIRLKWSAYQNYPDVLPIEMFAKETSKEPSAHIVLGPRGGRHTARFLLEVKGQKATLDYRPFKKFNEARDLVPGEMVFIFTDKRRTLLREVYWDDEVQGPNDLTITYTTGDADTLSATVHERQRVLAKVTLRPGQAEFRDRLNLAYGFRCALSGCPVVWSLDAAHIKSVRSGGTDDTANGLPLRRDLHALFDAGHLAFDPQHRRGHFSKEARQAPEYKRLNGQPLASPTHKGDAPKPEAFKRTWSAFLKSHGRTRA